ncbi:hypothetical protein C0993_011400 [Termitomyces sp. T159_Od127]|nr:hypothetical protein C0993_011400 [Termitomyces sp. T159_Od127]
MFLPKALSIRVDTTVITSDNSYLLSLCLFVTTRYRPPGLSPGPGTPALPKPPPRPPQARTATRPTPLAITAHHHPSTPLATATCGTPAITAVTATSAPGLSYHTTSAPAPPVTPSPCRDPHHASQSCITTDLTPARRAPLPLPLTAPLPCVSAFLVRDLHATRHVSTSPHMAPGSHPKPRRRDPLLEPRPEPRALRTA